VMRDGRIQRGRFVDLGGIGRTGRTGRTGKSD
jgi:hypothetical protein